MSILCILPQEQPFLSQCLQTNDVYVVRSEYIAKYNVNETVPFTEYDNPDQGVMTEISSASRGNVRPGFELLYAHYNDIRGLDASWTKEYVDYVNNATGGVEGGGGNYGSNSGGYDYLGFGTLMYRLTA